MSEEMAIYKIGRPPTQNLLGRKFGRLSVIESAGRDKRSNALWKCKCDCGSEKIVQGSKLLLKTVPTRSCGCIHKLPEGIGAMRKLLSGYKRDAKKRDLSFALSLEEFQQITKENCHYCGIHPLQIAGEKNHNGYYFYNGIDRINNDKGYIAENVLPCCKTCNAMKTNMSKNQFLLHIGKIAVQNKIMKGE